MKLHFWEEVSQNTIWPNEFPRFCIFLSLNRKKNVYFEEARLEVDNMTIILPGLIAWLKCSAKSER